LYTFDYSASNAPPKLKDMKLFAHGLGDVVAEWPYSFLMTLAYVPTSRALMSHLLPVTAKSFDDGSLYNIASNGDAVELRKLNAEGPFSACALNSFWYTFDARLKLFRYSLSPPYSSESIDLAKNFTTSIANDITMACDSKLGTINLLDSGSKPIVTVAPAPKLVAASIKKTKLSGVPAVSGSFGGPRFIAYGGTFFIFYGNVVYVGDSSGSFKSRAFNGVDFYESTFHFDPNA
jgi:hypothetical protein